MISDVFKSIAIVLYETICCKMFLEVFLSKRSEEKYKDVLAVIILLGIFTGIALFTTGSYILRCIYTVAVVFCFEGFFYKGKLFIKILLAGLYYGLMVSVDFLGIILINNTIGSYIYNNPSDIIQVMLVLLCKTVWLLIIILLEKIWKQKEEMEQIKSVEWVSMLAFPTVTIAIMLLMLFSFQKQNTSMIYLPVSFGLVFINLVLIFLIKYIARREREFFNARVMDERNRFQMQSYRENSRDYDHLNGMLHDYSNQLGCIQGLIKEGKVAEAGTYVEKLNQTLVDGRDVIDVNQSVINIILNQKYRQARCRGIGIVFQVNDLADIWLEEQDIVILLSNLLDNAIEACEKLPDKKIIRFKMIREDHQLVISIHNPVFGMPKIKNNQLLTNKKETKSHGFGLKNVQTVINRYEGMGTYRLEDGWFYYTAIFPK